MGSRPSSATRNRTPAIACWPKGSQAAGCAASSRRTSTACTKWSATGRVLELHGTARRAACLDCHARFDIGPLVAQILAGDRVPTCRECGGRLKHATVSFGQKLPTDVLEEATPGQAHGRPAGDHQPRRNAVRLGGRRRAPWLDRRRVHRGQRGIHVNPLMPPPAASPVVPNDGGTENAASRVVPDPDMAAIKDSAWAARPCYRLCSCDALCARAARAGAPRPPAGPPIPAFARYGRGSQLPARISRSRTQHHPLPRYAFEVLGFAERVNRFIVQRYMGRSIQR